MKGLDTNVLVRFLVKDDIEQSAAAVRYIRTASAAGSRCFINRVVLCELDWVLESAYGYARETVADVIEKILRAGDFLIEDADEAWAALRTFRRGGADFADCLISETNLVRGCEATVTFDRRAGRMEGFELLSAGRSAR